MELSPQGDSKSILYAREYFFKGVDVKKDKESSAGKKR